MARVLVIDDDPLVRGLLRDALSRAGHHVRECGDGAPVAAALVAGTADLVVCDLFMPGVDGIETLAAARRADPTVPVVAVSGGGPYGRADVLEMAAALGAAAALPKPVRPAALVELVAGLVAGRAPAPAPCANGLDRAAAAGRVCPHYHTCPDAGASAWCGPWPRPNRP